MRCLHCLKQCGSIQPEVLRSAHKCLGDAVNALMLQSRLTRALSDALGRARKTAPEQVRYLLNNVIFYRCAKEDYALGWAGGDCPIS